MDTLCREREERREDEIDDDGHGMACIRVFSFALQRKLVL
jgi:hypothetical protein